jgi:outer membrane protein assembly factor BamE (lipoprotein component of BamABCDE complex)
VVAAVLALALTASSARAVIVVQRSIGGVKLQMTKAQVRAKLGRPMRVHVGSNEFGTFVEKVYKRVTVTFQSGDRVTNVRTTSPLEQTASGVGVGSTKSQVKAGVPNVTCKNESGFKHCFVGAFLPGRTITDFRLRSNGRVSSVSIGFVID